MTSSVEARKIFAVSPNAGLVALAAGIGRIVTSVLVAMGLPGVAAGVQRDLQLPSRFFAPGRDVFNDLAGDALVPDVQAISTGRHVVDRKAAVVGGDRKSTRLNSSHVRDHARVHVAV